MWQAATARERGRLLLKKFFRSPYTRAGLTMLIVGSLLIIFSGWVSKSKLSIGFETINKTLMPIYIGIVFAFLLTPIYNKVVKHAYKYMCTRTRAIPFARGPHSLEPIVKEAKNDAEEKRLNLRIARIIATITCLIVLLGSISLMVYFVVPQFIQSSIELVTNAPSSLADFSAWLTENFTRFPAFTHWFDQIANAGTNEILKWVQTHLLNEDTVELATTISNSLFSLLGTFVDVIIGVLIMVYLLNNKDRIFAISRKLLTAICSERRRENIYEFTGIVNEIFLGFLSGRIIDAVIIGVLTYFVMLIFGISFAPMISVLVGVTNIIPFFGPIIGAIPSTLILLIEDPMEALYFLIIIMIIQQLDGNVIGPKVVGNAIGVDSFMVLISVLIGGGLFGFLGMILGVPVFAVIYIYVNKLAIKTLDKKDLDTRTDEYFTLDQYDIDATEVAGKKQMQERKKREKKSIRQVLSRKTAQSEQADVPEAVSESLLIDTTEVEENDN